MGTRKYALFERFGAARIDGPRAPKFAKAGFGAKREASSKPFEFKFKRRLGALSQGSFFMPTVHIHYCHAIKYRYLRV